MDGMGAAAGALTGTCMGKVAGAGAMRGTGMGAGAGASKNMGRGAGATCGCHESGAGPAQHQLGPSVIWAPAQRLEAMTMLDASGNMQHGDGSAAIQPRSG